MAIFRDYDGQGRDRSAEDRRRHRQLVEESIKKNIGNIIAEESIIGQSKDKIIKVPIRGLKEYGFYGETAPGWHQELDRKNGVIVLPDRLKGQVPAMEQEVQKGMNIMNWI